MTCWIWVVAAGVIGVCLGCVLMGSLLKSSRQVALEDKIIDALQGRSDPTEKE